MAPVELVPAAPVAPVLDGVLVVLLLPPKISLIPPGSMPPPEPPLERLPPLGPVPAMVVAPPANGWPKKPIAVGVLF